MPYEEQPPPINVFDPNAVRLNDLTDKFYRDQVAQSFVSIRDMLAQGVTQWGFEVVKHLSIVNAAGIAGATALATSTKPIAVAALGSVYWFLCGLVAAIIAMIVIYFVGFAYLRVFNKQFFSVLASTQPISSMKPPPWFWIMIGINWSLCALSLVLFLGGVIHLVSAA